MQLSNTGVTAFSADLVTAGSFTSSVVVSPSDVDISDRGSGSESRNAHARLREALGRLTAWNRSLKWMRDEASSLWKGNFVPIKIQMRNSVVFHLFG